LHITLQFLAEAQSAHIETILKEVRREVDGFFSHSKFTLADLHVFPNPYRPRVIVMDVQPQEVLHKLAEAIGRGIQAVGYQIEDRPYRAHLTLGRIKQPKGVDLHFLGEAGQSGIEAIEVNEVALYRSEPQEDGSHYTVLERIELG
jgi:2'-5' RNA ligase